jgi:hypothetical protein
MNDQGLVAFQYREEFGEEPGPDCSHVPTTAKGFEYFTQISIKWGSFYSGRLTQLTCLYLIARRSISS